MKKIILFFAGVMTLMVSSCDDMLDVDGGRQVEMPEINQKTDSLFYVAGIMQAMQQAAEVYVIQNEMRGDLATTTVHSDRNLQELANFSATTTNKYDSAYVYYKVVNNCNYYLAHRDTALYDGAYNVTLDEYAAVLSYRAWAYLQLARTYGKVKFFTHPLTSLSQIENDNSPMLDIEGIVNELAPQLIQFRNSGIPFSNYISKLGDYEFIWERCCIPVNVILGELYLEVGRYSDAAKCYYEFLFRNKILAEDMRSLFNIRYTGEIVDLPNDFSPGGVSGMTWITKINNVSTNLSSVNGTSSGAITYIPMADKSLNGYTTEIPKLFGFDYYYYNSHSESEQIIDSVYLKNKQIVASDVYNLLADSADYYYQTNDPIDPQLSVLERVGDMRARARIDVINRDNVREEILQTYITKKALPRVVLYRPSTIWLHLAEALNRMGYPDAAFAILKDGITDNMRSYQYVRDETWNMLTTEIPFCSNDGRSEQSQLFSGTGTNHNYGIHRHGCSDQYGISGDKSLYKMSVEVEKKIAELQDIFNGEQWNVSVVDRTADIQAVEAEIDAVGNDASISDEEKTRKLKELDAQLAKLNKEFNSLGKWSLQDVINAVEDLICDEYAMEFAFEGSRFADLARLARNKNGKGTGGYSGSPAGYGANFGGRWLAKKLAFKNPVKDLTVESNWYLDMK